MRESRSWWVSWKRSLRAVNPLPVEPVEPVSRVCSLAISLRRRDKIKKYSDFNRTTGNRPTVIGYSTIANNNA